MCGSYSWLSFKERCTLKHDNNFSNSLDHAEQCHEAVPQLTPTGFHMVQGRQMPGSAGASALLHTQGRVVHHFAEAPASVLAAPLGPASASLCCVSAL